MYPGGTQPFSDINQEGNTIQLDNVDNAKKVLADFKKVGRLKFKVAVEEEKENLTKEKKNGIKNKMTDTGKDVTPDDMSPKMPKVKNERNRV